jgi:hypothetical protein
MEIVRLIDEQRHGFATALDQVPQPPLPDLGLRGEGGLFVGADVGEDRLHECADFDALFVHGEIRGHQDFPLFVQVLADPSGGGRLPTAGDAGEGDEMARLDGGLEGQGDLVRLLGVTVPRIPQLPLQPKKRQHLR